MKSFSELKKKRNDTYKELAEEAQKLNQKGNWSDDRFWSCKRDDHGNGYAIIRFLPAPKGEDVPWVRVWSHGFQGPTGKWYIENSLTTIGKPDPVAEANSELWNSGLESDKDIARARKRRLNYYTNVYVVKDPANPQNEGKVFLFKFGKKIFDHIHSAMHPEFEDETPINPFDFWEGANFKLKIRNADGYANYDKSEFEKMNPLSDDDAKLEEIWNQEYSLQEFIAEDKFKSYDELKRKFDMVVSGGGYSSTAEEDSEVEKESEGKTEKEKTSPEVNDEKEEKTIDIENDDELDAFRKLAEDD